MALRETLRQYPAIGGGLALVLLIAAGLALVRSFGAGGQRHDKPQVYFIDLDNDRLLAAADDGQTPRVPNVVRAYVFACGDCADAAGRFVSYVQTLGPNGIAELIKKPEVQDPAVIAAATRVATYTPGEAPRWIPMAGPAGEAVRASPWQRCADATPCSPP